MFDATSSITSSDMNNMLRGFYRDNSDHAVTGTLLETALSAFTVPLNSIGATGTLFVQASGTTAGTAGAKTIKLYFGSFNTQVVVPLANTDEWQFSMWLYNTATNAQRYVISTGRNASGGGTSTVASAITTSAVDTTGNQICEVTGTLANAGDTITCKTFNIYICQIS